MIMKKSEYIEMLCQDIETEKAPMKNIYMDVIDCVEIALSQEPADFDVDASISLVDLYKIIEVAAKENQKSDRGATSVGPFMAAELFAKRFGAHYQRASKRIAAGPKISLEDFFND